MRTGRGGEPLRRLRFGLSTVLGLAPRGFFIPYRYAATVRPVAYPALVPLFDRADGRMAALLDRIAAHAPDLRRIAAGPGPARFDQDWFPRLDAAAAYAIVRAERPGRIVEIGSGHSTRFLARAAADGGLATEITAIDPAPRASLDGLGIRHLPTLLDESTAVIAGIGAGDILFVDSSHVAVPGSDVDRIVGHVLPALPSGAILHLHDILLPDPYPRDWAWRGYNEATVVAALLAGGGWEILFSSHWVATRHPDRLCSGILRELPLPAGARETSLWLRRR